MKVLGLSSDNNNMNNGNQVPAVTGLQQLNQITSRMSEELRTREVWASNFEQEFCTVRELAKKYKYIAMDTEFPGVVMRPLGEFRNNAEYQYQLIRCNVDILKCIQLGFTFMDENGNTPPTGPRTFQFNFKFNLVDDLSAEDSIALLKKSGIQFKKHNTDGIDTFAFAELLLTSGLVLTDSIRWLTFHGGYDFGYLLRMLMGQNLPKDETGFFELLKMFFPHVYDIKYLMKCYNGWRGGLQELAGHLKVERVGMSHQAGSDSLVTGMTFFRMKKVFFGDNIDESKYSGHIFGIGDG